MEKSLCVDGVQNPPPDVFFCLLLRQLLLHQRQNWEELKHFVGSEILSGPSAVVKSDLRKFCQFCRRQQKRITNLNAYSKFYWSAVNQFRISIFLALFNTIVSKINLFVCFCSWLPAPHSPFSFSERPTNPNCGPQFGTMAVLQRDMH